MHKIQRFSRTGPRGKISQGPDSDSFLGRRAYLKQNVQRRRMNSVRSQHATSEASEALFREDDKCQSSMRSNLSQPLEIYPFKRMIANSNVSEYKARDHEEGFTFQALRSPLKIPCPYCSGLIRINSQGCSHCLRGLQNYWLWENAVYKRVFLLLGLAILPLLIVALILFV